MPRIESLSPEHQRTLRALNAAWRETPADLVQVAGGYYMTFDTWLAHVLPFRLRPTRTHLAAQGLLRSFDHAARQTS